jgi:6-phosphogluconolactonase (cycloisomerase 2 family)
MNLHKHIGLALLGIIGLSGQAATAADEALPKLRTEIKEDADLKLDWAWQPYVAGKLFFLSVHRSGTVAVFSRDEQTGDVQFLQAIPVAADLGSAGRHLDPHLAFSTKNILYVAGEWTHAGSDQHSIGLSWYQVDPKDGAFTKLGNIPCSAGVLHASPDPNTLYLSATFAKQIHVIRLDPRDGKPVVAEKIDGKGLGRALVAAPDRKFYYALNGDTVSWLTATPDGKLTLSGSLTLPDLTIQPSDCSLFLSPDGKHAYAALFKRYDKPESAYVALLTRDAATGALTFGERLPHMGMGGIGQVVFAPDGRTAYFCADPERPASGFGSFQRDPETGKLDNLIKAKGANAASFLAYDSISGTIYLGGTWSTKSFKLFTVPQVPAGK